MQNKPQEMTINQLEKRNIMNLQDIRNAVISYVDNKVTVTISQITPTAGSEIDPNEDFTFTLTAQNADAASGGIPLRNVVWQVWVDNDAVGKLYVPTGMTARSSRSTTSDSNKLTEGTLVREMYLFPSFFVFPPIHLPTPSLTLPAPDLSSRLIWPWRDSANYLGVGDTDSIALKGKGLTQGASAIQFKIYADVDMDWLFPTGQDSATASKAFQVV